MHNKKLKYAEYLDNYQNCPGNDYKEIEGNFCRWINLENNENNFKPLNIINTPPQRLLDNQDKLCIGYGLSFFNTIDNAHLKYYERYQKQKREHLKEIFKNDKGSFIAIVNIHLSDGIADDPNPNSGHFTFHEYETTKLDDKISMLINIFEENGSIKNQIQ